jgi:hypothetical protein
MLCFSRSAACTELPGPVAVVPLDARHPPTTTVVVVALTAYSVFGLTGRLITLDQSLELGWHAGHQIIPALPQDQGPGEDLRAHGGILFGRDEEAAEGARHQCADLDGGWAHLEPRCGPAQHTAEHTFSVRV